MMYTFMDTITNTAIKKNNKSLFFVPSGEVSIDSAYHPPNTLEKFLEFQFSNFVQFLYNEFENYIYNCIKAILISSPGIMTEKQISIGDIIKYDYDTGRVIEFKAEKVAEEYLRPAIEKAIEKIGKDFKLRYKITEEELQKLNRFSEIRNLYTHRRGIIDKKFIANMGEEKYKEGIFLELESIEFYEYIKLINIISTRFDIALRIKYPNLVVNVP